MENSTQESYLKSKNTTANHEYPYPIYVVAFSSSAVHHSNHRRLALGSFIEELSNQVDVVSFEDKTLSVTTNLNLSFDHPYPPTKLMFYPKPSASLLKSSDVIASSGDFLHLWEVRDDSIDPLSVLNNSKSSEFFALLASFDWNEVETQQIGTSSIDMTCTIWDIEKEVVETQLIAHDKEVHDISWDKAKIFAFVFANGSVRIFDLRDKEHSTIIYESQQPDTPLLRLAWNKVVILVIRSLTVLVAEL